MPPRQNRNKKQPRKDGKTRPTSDKDFKKVLRKVKKLIRSILLIFYSKSEIKKMDQSELEIFLSEKFKPFIIQFLEKDKYSNKSIEDINDEFVAFWFTEAKINKKNLMRRNNKNSFIQRIRKISSKSTLRDSKSLLIALVANKAIDVLDKIQCGNKLKIQQNLLSIFSTFNG